MSAEVSVSDTKLGGAGPNRAAIALTRGHATWQRWAVIALALAAIALWGLAWARPWWQFHLFAPQYPNGLVLDIALTGVGGDAREVSMLNHYIGMKSLEEAAQIERKYAAWGVGLVAVLSAALALAVGRRWNWLILLPAVAFPIGFVADSMYWLYHFGHTMDPKAPLRIPAFTPQFFGWGKIGQFETYAMPLSGFWLAMGALGAIAIATVLRYRVCKTCPVYASCGNTCPRKLVGPAGGGDHAP